MVWNLSEGTMQVVGNLSEGLEALQHISLSSSPLP